MKKFNGKKVHLCRSKQKRQAYSLSQNFKEWKLKSEFWSLCVTKAPRMTLKELAINGKKYTYFWFSLFNCFNDFKDNILPVSLILLYIWMLWDKPGSLYKPVVRKIPSIEGNLFTFQPICYFCPGSQKVTFRLPDINSSLKTNHKNGF